MHRFDCELEEVDVVEWLLIFRSSRCMIHLHKARKIEYDSLCRLHDIMTRRKRLKSI